MLAKIATSHSREVQSVRVFGFERRTRGGKNGMTKISWDLKIQNFFPRQAVKITSDNRYSLPIRYTRVKRWSVCGTVKKLCLYRSLLLPSEQSAKDSICIERKQDLKGSMQPSQKACLLATAKIMRKVMDTNGDGWSPGTRKWTGCRTQSIEIVNFLLTGRFSRRRNLGIEF